MGRPPPAVTTTRKSLAIPDRIWVAVDAARRTQPGRMPSEVEMVRILLDEALDARAKAAERRKKK